ncbi:MAG: cytochrome c [Rhodospirillales bacterium]
MKPFIRKSAVCLALMLMGFAAGNLVLTGLAPAADIPLIDKRQDVMKNVVLKNFVIVKDFVKKGKGSARDVQKAADALVQVASKIPPLFPEGTGRPEVAAKKTRANPEIWFDWDEFVSAAKTLGSEAAKLSKAAAGGDKEAIAQQFVATGKKGCGGCHKTFRGAKVK